MNAIPSPIASSSGRILSNSNRRMPSNSTSSIMSTACCLTKKHCVFFVAFVEIVVAMVTFAGLIYATSNYNTIKHILLIPSQFIPDQLAMGLLNGWAILCAFQLLLGLILLDGAKHAKACQLIFWMTCMFAFKVIVCSLMIGVEIAGCRAPEVNTFIFTTVFARFIEMLVVYVYMEEEKLQQKRLKLRRYRRQSINSNNSSFSNLTVVMEEDEFHETETEQLQINGNASERVEIP